MAAETKPIPVIPATEGLFFLIQLTAELGIGETTDTLANPGPQFSGHWDVTAILNSDSIHHHEMTQELTVPLSSVPACLLAAMLLTTLVLDSNSLEP